MTTWIRCETRDQLRVVLKYFKSKGWIWFDGKDPKPKKESKKYFDNKKHFRIAFEDGFGYNTDPNLREGDTAIDFKEWFDQESMKTGFEKFIWNPMTRNLEKQLKTEYKLDGKIDGFTIVGQGAVETLRNIWNFSTTDKVSDESDKNPQSRVEEPVKWEFNVVSVMPGFVNKATERAQKEGWELAGSVTLLEGSGGSGKAIVTYIPFKRKIK